MTYGSGLRVSEVVNVKLGHIDRDRGMMFVESGKGHKDRYTMLSSTRWNCSASTGAGIARRRTSFSAAT